METDHDMAAKILRFAHTIGLVSSGFRRRRRNFQGILGLVLADNDKASLADEDDCFDLGVEGLMGDVRAKCNELRRNAGLDNLQILAKNKDDKENCDSRISAFIPASSCDRQGASRTRPRCAPNVESPDAAQTTRLIYLSGNERRIRRVEVRRIG
jgi:hypothetical protein